MTTRTKRKPSAAQQWTRSLPDAIDDIELTIAKLARRFSLSTLAAVQLYYEERKRTHPGDAFVAHLERSDSVGAFDYAKPMRFVLDPEAPRFSAKKNAKHATVRIGHVDVRRVALGSMRLVSSPFEHEGRWLDAFGLPFNPEENLHALLNAIRVCGVNYIDISRGYGPFAGAGEMILHDWLAPFDDDLLVATKVGYRREPSGAWLVDLAPDAIARDVERSVARFGGRVPLLYLVLRSTPDVRIVNRPNDLARSLAPLLQAQADGRVRHIGIANATRAEIELFSQQAPALAVVQNNFTLAAFDDAEKRAAFDVCRERALPFVMWGLFGQDAWPRPKPDARLARDAKALGVDHHQLTLALLLRSAPNVIVLPGASRRATVYSSVRAANLAVPDDIARKYTPTARTQKKTRAKRG